MWKIYDFFEGRLLDEDHRYAPQLDLSIPEPNARVAQGTSEEAQSAKQPPRH